MAVPMKYIDLRKKTDFEEFMGIFSLVKIPA